MIEQQSRGISWSLFCHQHGRARRPGSDNGRYGTLGGVVGAPQRPPALRRCLTSPGTGWSVGVAGGYRTVNVLVCAPGGPTVPFSPNAPLASCSQPPARRRLFALPTLVTSPRAPVPAARWHRPLAAAHAARQGRASAEGPPRERVVRRSPCRTVGLARGTAQRRVPWPSGADAGYCHMAGSVSGLVSRT